MIKLKNILNEQRPIPMDTPNEFAYLDFKKYAHKNRSMFKKEMMKHVRKSDGQADSSRMFKTLSALWFKWAYHKNKEFRHIKDDQKFGRALMGMMVQDNLIFDKKAWKKDNNMTHLKEQDTRKIDQAITKSKGMPIVDRIKMINQIRRMLGERSKVVTENPNLKALKVASLYDPEGPVKEKVDEKIAGYHTLQEDGIGNINGHSISLEIEETPEGLRRGLMHRKDLPSGKGMLLKFGKKKPTNIWMKNVNFPLDVIYLQDDKVVDMYKNAKPDSGDGQFDHLKGVECDTVLELPAGDAAKYGIELGNMFGFNDLRNTRGHEDIAEQAKLSLRQAATTGLPSSTGETETPSWPKTKTTDAFTTQQNATPYIKPEKDTNYFQDIGNNATGVTDFLTKPHDIYNKGGLNVKGQVNMPSVDASWDPNNSLTQWGGPQVDVNNSANLSADYDMGKAGKLSGKVNYATGNKPTYNIGYTLNI
jgi:uncharacterized membrane protein (UPF0127 family)